VRAAAIDQAPERKRRLSASPKGIARLRADSGNRALVAKRRCSCRRNADLSGAREESARASGWRRPAFRGGNSESAPPDHLFLWRVHGNRREFGDERGPVALPSTAPSSWQQLVAGGNRARAWRFEKRKTRRPRQLERRNAQDTPRPASAQVYPARCTRAAPRSRPAYKPHTDAALTRQQRPRAGWTQHARSSRYAAGHLVRKQYALDADEPGVDHASDARHSEPRSRRTLVASTLRRPWSGGRKRAAAARRQSREQRQDFHRRRRYGGARATLQQFEVYRISRSRQEYQNSPGPSAKGLGAATIAYSSSPPSLSSFFASATVRVSTGYAPRNLDHGAGWSSSPKCRAKRARRASPR